LILFGVRLTLAQLLGIVVSMAGVLVIILRGDLMALASIEINNGDAMLAAALLVFGIYSALMLRRPVTHPMSLIATTTAGGALMTAPVSLWELNAGSPLIFDTVTLLTLGYAMIFPSALAYLFFNRGIALIGPNRAAPFLHLMPVFGSVMAIVFLGEQPQLFHLIGYVMVLAGVFIASRR
jgi:drug/metabolite transporter (DMT)-like permease